MLIQLAHGAMKAWMRKGPVKLVVQMPAVHAVYLGLDPLNCSLDLMTGILSCEADGSGFGRRYGEDGIE